MQQPELKQVRILKTKVIPITFSSQGARPSYDQSLKPDKGGRGGVMIHLSMQKSGRVGTLDSV